MKILSSLMFTGIFPLFIAVVVYASNEQNSLTLSASVAPSPSKKNHTIGNWLEAGIGNGDERIGDIERSHVVTLTQSGTIKGTISSMISNLESRAPLTSMEVFAVQKGNVVSQTTTDSQGNYSLPNLTPGVYSLIARGPDGFLAFGFTALPFDKDNDSFSSLDSVAVASSYNMVDVESRIQSPDQEQIRSVEKDDKFLAKEFSLVSEAVPATSIAVHKVPVLEDGRILGRLHKIKADGKSVNVANSDVILLQGEKEIARSISDELGVFEFAKVATGSYSLIASSSLGFAAIGFEVVDAKLPSDFVPVSTQDVPFDVPQNVSETINPIDIAVACPCEIPVAGTDEYVYETTSTCGVDPCSCGVSLESGCGCGAGGGGFGGGVGGGGLFGGGGLGPIGRLALTAGIAYGIAEAVNDDDDAPVILNSNQNASESGF